MLGLLQRATANLKNPVNPTQWDPADDLASGFHRFSQGHSLPVTSLGSFAFAATGYYAKGTIRFRRAEPATAEPEPPSGAQHLPPPPAYDDDSKPKVHDGQVHVSVEARTNSEGLYADSTLEPVQGHERCGISLTVRPAAARPGICSSR